MHSTNSIFVYVLSEARSSNTPIMMAEKQRIYGLLNLSPPSPAVLISPVLYVSSLRNVQVDAPSLPFLTTPIRFQKEVDATSADSIPKLHQLAKGWSPTKVFPVGIPLVR
jgi:hypothetical protein